MHVVIKQKGPTESRPRTEHSTSLPHRAGRRCRHGCMLAAVGVTTRLLRLPPRCCESQLLRKRLRAAAHSLVVHGFGTGGVGSTLNPPDILRRHAPRRRRRHQPLLLSTGGPRCGGWERGSASKGIRERDLQVGAALTLLRRHMRRHRGATRQTAVTAVPRGGAR